MDTLKETQIKKESLSSVIKNEGRTKKRVFIKIEKNLLNRFEVIIRTRDLYPSNSTVLCERSSNYV